MMCIISLIALILVIGLYANIQNKWIQSNEDEEEIIEWIGGDNYADLW